MGSKMATCGSKSGVKSGEVENLNQNLSNTLGSTSIHLICSGQILHIGRQFKVFFNFDTELSTKNLYNSRNQKTLTFPFGCVPLDSFKLEKWEQYFIWP